MSERCHIADCENEMSREPAVVQMHGAEMKICKECYEEYFAETMT